MTQYKFPPVVRQLVRKQLASGQFATEDEVLLAALQILETESENRLAVREADEPNPRQAPRAGSVGCLGNLTPTACRRLR